MRVRSILLPYRCYQLRLAVLILLCLAIRLPGLDPTLSDHSTWRQTDTATIARNFIDDPRILWPRVNWGAPGPGYVESEFQLYPYLTSIVYRGVGENPAIGRLITLFATGIAAWVLFHLARRFFADSLSFFCVATFLMEPIVFRYSYVFMPDASALLFYLIALERFSCHLDDERWSTILQSSAAMALAILIKPTAIHLGMLLIIMTIVRRGFRRVFHPRMLTFAAISLMPALAYYIHAARIYLTYGNTFGLILGGDSKWGTLALRFDPAFYWSVAFMETAWTVGPVGAIVAALGLTRLRSGGWRLLVVAWFGTTICYYLTVARYAGNPALGLHYHLFAAPLAAILTTAGIAVLAKWHRMPSWGVLVVCALVFGYQLASDVFILAYKDRHNLTMMAAGEALSLVSCPDDLILVLSEDKTTTADGLPNNYQQPNVFFRARRRGKVLAKDQQNWADLEAAISPGFKWFVNFPSLNGGADSSYFEFISERMTKVAASDDFEVYQISSADDSNADK